MRVENAVNIADLGVLARRRLPKVIFDFLDGGAEDEVTLRGNRQGFERYRFRPRLLTGNAKRDLSINLFGDKFALPFLIETSGSEALTFAARLLGLETDRPHQALRTMAAESPAALARAAAAVACGIAELHAYHSTGSTVTAWYRLLIGHGWEPDPWTSARIAIVDASA